MRPSPRLGGALCLVAFLAGPGAGAAIAADPRIPLEAPATDPSPADAERERAVRSSQGRSALGMLGSAAGVAAGVGLAMWLKSEANDRYDLYLTTADPGEAQGYLDEAQRYDRATLVGWVIAQASFFAFFYFFTREGKRPLVPLEGEPLIAPSEDGIVVGMRFTP